MIRYVALLRGINVGGRNLIKMEDLSRLFTRCGLSNVTTYIQSGNVIFESMETNVTELAETIEKKLYKTLGQKVSVLLRTVSDLEKMVRRNPFKRVKPGDDVMLFVTFLAAEPNRKPKLPLIAASENLEAFQIKDRAVFIIARRRKNGWFGFPNNFIEKELGVSATTRNWTTVNKLFRLC